VALLTLNRPTRLNAWTGEMGAALVAALHRAAADDQVRVVVLTGAGKGFCAGADMGGLQSLGSGSRAQQKPPQPPPKLEDDFILTPARISKPVICAINGSCAGMGLSFALNCDIRFAASGSKFTAAFPKRGLIAEHGMSWALPNLVGTGNAMLFLLSSGVFLAEECQRMGLVQRVFPKEKLLEESLDFARNLAMNVPINSMAIIKQQLLHHPLMDRSASGLESNCLMIATANPKNPDFKEGVDSFVKKRDPNFSTFDTSREAVKVAQELFNHRGARL